MITFLVGIICILFLSWLIHVSSQYIEDKFIHANKDIATSFDILARESEFRRGVCVRIAMLFPSIEKRQVYNFVRQMSYSNLRILANFVRLQSLQRQTTRSASIIQETTMNIDEKLERYLIP